MVGSQVPLQLAVTPALHRGLWPRSARRWAEMAEQRQATRCLKDPLLRDLVGPAPGGQHSGSSPTRTDSEPGWALPWGLPTHRHQPQGGPGRGPSAQEGSIYPHRAVAPNLSGSRDRGS